MDKDVITVEFGENLGPVKFISLISFLSLSILTIFYLCFCWGSWEAAGMETYEMIQRVLITISCEVVTSWHLIQILRYLYESPKSND